MKHHRYIEESGMIGFVLCTCFVVSLAGCIGYIMPPPVARVPVAPPAPPPVVQPVVVPVVIQYEYLYYPGYELYYSTSRRQYIYLENGRWIASPAPRGLSLNVVLASPSVRMEFRDSPGIHHAAMVRKYPRNWRPKGTDSNPNGRPTGRYEDKQSGRDDNAGGQ